MVGAVGSAQLMYDLCVVDTRRAHTTPTSANIDKILQNNNAEMLKFKQTRRD
jgi:hypothetical protein